MGIKNINTSLVKKFCKNRFVELPLKKLSGRSLAIDTSYFMYRLKASATKTVVENSIFYFDNGEWNEVDNDKVVGVWLKQFGYLIAACKKNNIKPIFVLDGIAPEEKAITQEGRRQKIKNQGVKQKEYKCDPDQLQKYKQTVRNNTFITQQDRVLLFQLFASSKCEIVQAGGEAEKYCAKMCNTGRVFAAVSADTDLYAYGCKVIISDINFMNSFYEPTVTIVVMSDILKSLKMTQEEFLFLCILSGNDFNPNIPQYGPKTCYELIKEHGIYENRGVTLKNVMLHKDGDEITKVDAELVDVIYFDARKTYEKLKTAIPEFEKLDFEASYEVFTCESLEMDLPNIEKIELATLLKTYMETDDVNRFLRIL